MPYEEITRSYECEDGTQVTISDLELEAIEPRKTRTIDIEQFVDLTDVDPIYFDHPYFLLPSSDDDGATRAYRLLTEVMDQTDRAALGRFVMRAKEYLAIVRVRDRALTLTTMRFADEVRSPKDVDAATQKAHKPTTKQLNAAVAVIEELSDRVGSRQVQGSVPRAAAGSGATQAQGPDGQSSGHRQGNPPPAPDLMAALEQTLAELSGESGSNGKSNKRQRQEAR